MINSWSKILSRTDLGLGGTHDEYLNIPKSALRNPKIFFEKAPGLPRTATNPPSEDNWQHLELIDKKTEATYKVRYEWAKTSKQTRLYELRECYDARKAAIGDEFIVEKAKIDGKLVFFVDILRNGATTILTPDQLNKELKKKQKPKFKPRFNPQSRSYRSGISRKKTDIIKQAEIYKVTFSVENRTFIYVGQDSFCSGPNWYFGSSSVMFHYEEIFGSKIFKKEIITKVQDMVLRDLNTIERKYIREAKEEAKAKGWYSVNYN